MIIGAVSDSDTHQTKRLCGADKHIPATIASHWRTLAAVQDCRCENLRKHRKSYQRLLGFVNGAQEVTAPIHTYRKTFWRRALGQ